MNKNFIIDYVNHKIVIACGPEFSIECEEWYPKYFNQSISDYIMILTEYLHHTDEKAFLLSYYDPCRELNVIEKKKGMAGVFQQLKQEYQSESEIIIERDWKNIIISVVSFTGANKNIFFNKQPQSILCIGKYITLDNLLTLGFEKGLDAFLKEFFQYGSTIIQYNDISCDGNNITFTFKNKILKYHELINLLTLNGYISIEDKP